MKKSKIRKAICRTGSCIVKRRGHVESFDERKVYASCYAACLSTHMQKEIAERICSKVARDIKAWLKAKKTVTSTQIFHAVAKTLKSYNKDAAFMYATHRDIS